MHYRRRRTRSVILNEPLVRLPGHILHLLRISPSITRINQQAEYRVVSASAEEFWTLSLHNHWFTDHFIFNVYVLCLYSLSIPGGFQRQ